MIKSMITLQVLFLSIWAFFSVTKTNEAVPASQITVCHTPLESLPEKDGMKQFALDPAFQALHLAPLPLSYDATGKDITFKTPDGMDAKGYFIKAKGNSNKWLFVYQEWWGLNDYIKRQSDTYYKDLGEDVNVLALDMYDGKVTSNPQEAGKLVSGVNETRLENIVKGGIAYAGKNAKIANVGWCFGGGWSLRSGLLGGSQTVGTVMYYGMPVRDVEQLKKLNGDVLGLFATETRISKEVIEEFDANMKAAGKKLTYKIFDGVHGFANPSNPKYDEALAKEAYAMSLAYLKKKF
ncbi:dienelactone hydrolase family protein [Emticicia agri]|uniref:Dienelactone hydrolase n=1 Tax=Emticicia agri TaxID=2492393 RepID=A0A4Q5LZM9_9BACT|nr:dienelactone hydrolase family protein [Emticicia agri]RYU95381.1 dienelactone hydrolase [Emticicia agri]